MRAAVVTPPSADRPVSVEVVPDPSPPSYWVTVELRHAALNRLDALMLAARTTEETGAVLGSDGAGTIRALGDGLTPSPGMSVGDEVLILPSLFWGPSPVAPGPSYQILGSPTNGTHAELVVVPAANVYPRPRHLSSAQAAALPMASLTAWRALVTRGRLEHGETVVVGAASSGVGSAAVQIAASLGARVVAVTAGSDKAAAALRLGATHVVDRLADDFHADLLEVTGGRAELALDPTGALWQPLADALAPGGRLVTVGRLAADLATVRVQSVYWKQLDLLGSSMGSPVDFAGLLTNIETTGWAPLVDSTHALTDIAAAYARLDHPDRTGKVVVDVTA